jgi:uncharacterized protein
VTIVDMPVTTEHQHLASARASLAQTLRNYQQAADAAAHRPGGTALKTLLEQELAQLTTTLDKLDRRVVRIAVFGLVSRGKSAVLNALSDLPDGDRLITGPLNGVTQQVKVITWSPAADSEGVDSEAAATIELYDTPGLDEIDGAARSAMAAAVAAQSDLILFVVAGAITPVEYAALCELRSAQKPLILVFNKIDLYPDQTGAQLYQDLLTLNQQSIVASDLAQLLTADEVVLVAADPVAQQVRVEQADGAVDYRWEKPPIVIEPLQQKILGLLQREGRSLLALNALAQSERAERVMTAAIVEGRELEAEALIWQFARYKAIGVGLNPLGFLDFVGGAIADLTLIRSLSKLYGLPMTRYEAGKLLQTILLSSGGLLATELLGWLVGVAKGLAILTDGNVAGWLAVGSLQAGVAGYGAYAVGRSAQAYLEQGASWGDRGAKTVMREILGQVDAAGVIARMASADAQPPGSGLG